MTKDLNTERLEPLISRIRGHRVIADHDLARLYGVTTKRFNQAFKRNRGRFPSDFAFQLTRAEVENLRSQSVTSSLQGTDSSSNNRNRSQFVTGSYGGRRYLAWVFTEHGALMAANVLRSERAVQMSVFLIRAFVRLREQVAANTAILKRLAEIDKTLLEHDSALRDLYRKLLSLLEEPERPMKAIGFHADIE
jgi:ORF6N domain-containing protein